MFYSGSLKKIIIYGVSNEWDDYNFC